MDSFDIPLSVLVVQILGTDDNMDISDNTAVEKMEQIKKMQLRTEYKLNPTDIVPTSSGTRNMFRYIKYDIYHQDIEKLAFKTFKLIPKQVNSSDDIVHRVYANCKDNIQ